MGRPRDSLDIFIPDGVPVSAALGRTTHLAIAAHQDDVEIMAYPGIVECYRSRDLWFTGVVVTNGMGSPRSGPYFSVDPTEMAEVRSQEQRKAATVGNYSAVIQLGYDSAAVKCCEATEVQYDLRSIIEACRPDILYLHNPADKHDTHVAVFGHSLLGLRSLPPNLRPRQIYGCEVWRSLDWVLERSRIALSTAREPHLAKSLLGVFDSQIASGKQYDLATIGRWRANATFNDYQNIDEFASSSFALDLTPLVEDISISPVDFVGSLIDDFRADAVDRLGRLGFKRESG